MNVIDPVWLQGPSEKPALRAFAFFISPTAQSALGCRGNKKADSNESAFHSLVIPPGFEPGSKV